jgi:hypothetical protein
MNSDKLKALFKDWRITLIAGVVVGLLLGLLVGWGIWPVQWTDLAPYHMREDLREDYLRMAIFTTSMTGDTTIAQKAWSELEDTAGETLTAVQMNAGYLTPEQITYFESLVDAEAADVVVPTGEATTAPDVTPAAGDEEEEPGGPNWLLLGGFCVVLLVGAGIAIYFFIIRPRKLGEAQQEDLKSMVRERVEESMAASDYGGEGLGYTKPISGYSPPEEDEPQLPVAQFMTTYMMGDDLYDDSFSIDAPTGEFLGECGVGISDTVGVGEPKRVSAFEVWLFDKNDIQTVTKVVMSEHVYEDNKTRMRLESKGEPILAEPGKVILLETATLQLEARIVDMEYGEGAAPDQSFFQRMTLELSVWSKERGSF